VITCAIFFFGKHVRKGFLFHDNLSLHNMVHVEEPYGNVIQEYLDWLLFFI